MKKLISIVLCLILIFSMIPSAYAVTPKKSGHSDIYNNIVNALKEYNLEYSTDERGEDEDEHIEITVTDEDIDLENFSTIVLDLYVNKEYNRVNLFNYYVIEYDENISVKDYNRLLEAVNDANYDFNYVKFYADEEYCSVDAQFTSYVRADSAGEIVIDMISAITLIVDSAYDTLSDFDIS